MTAWRAAVLLAVLVLLIPLCRPGAAAASSGCDRDEWTDLGGLAKEAHPVILVHGFTGSAMHDTRTLLEERLPSGWQFLVFDYSDASTQWAASDEVAGCLPEYIREVSDAHRQQGGDGVVFLVAHSMGGLAPPSPSAEVSSPAGSQV